MAKLDEDKVNAAAEAAMNRNRNRSVSAEPDDDDDEPVREGEVIELKPPGEDDDDDDDSSKTPEERETARDRRRQRGKSFREEIEDRARAAEERAARAEDFVRSMAPVLQSALAPREQQPQGLPEDQELEALHEDWRAREEAFVAKWSGKQIPPEEQAKANRLATELRVRESEIMFRRNQRLHGVQGITQEDVDRATLRAPIRDLLEHPNPRVRAEFEAGFRYEIALGKRQNTQADLYSYADEIRRKHGLLKNQPARPSAQTRQRLSGQSRGANGAGEGATRVRVTDAIRDLAVAAAPGMSEEKAVERWMKKHGRNLAAKEAAQGRRVD